MTSADMETYSVGDAIDSLGFGKFQLLLSFMVGFANVADAMEMMILSILAPALHCHWHVTQYQQASLTTVVFLGMMISSVVWGKMADQFGRRLTLILTSVFLCYFGMITSFAPSFNWVLFLRFLVGFFIGGVPQACTLYAEYLPTKFRGQAILVLSFFWALGACLEALIAWLVMPTLGWRYLVFFSTLPLVMFLLMSPMLPESPMYLAVMGRKEEVETQLNRVARMNGKPPMRGHLVLDAATSGELGSIGDLFRNGMYKLTLMVFFLWFVAASTYYGVVLLSTELLNSSRDTCSASAETTEKEAGEQECSLHSCRGLMEDDYVSLIWTTFAEFPGTILAMLLIDRVGRKKTLAIQAFCFAISTLAIMECALSKNLLVVVLFAARGTTAGLFQTVYVYTPEVYPTRLRAVALGCGSGFARIGAMITPYIAQVLLRSSLYSAVSVYALLGVLAGIVALCLPVEPLGQSLSDKQSTQFGSSAPKSPTSVTTDKNSLVDAMELNEQAPAVVETPQ